MDGQKKETPKMCTVGVPPETGLGNTAVDSELIHKVRGDTSVFSPNPK